MSPKWGREICAKHFPAELSESGGPAMCEVTMIKHSFFFLLLTSLYISTADAAVWGWQSGGRHPCLEQLSEYAKDIRVTDADQTRDVSVCAQRSAWEAVSVTRIDDTQERVAVWGWISGGMATSFWEWLMDVMD